MLGSLGSDTNSPTPDAGMSALTLNLFTGSLSVNMSLGPLIPDWEAKRAFTQLNRGRERRSPSPPSEPNPPKLSPSQLDQQFF